MKGFIVFWCALLFYVVFNDKDYAIESSIVTKTETQNQVEENAFHLIPIPIQTTIFESESLVIYASLLPTLQSGGLIQKLMNNTKLISFSQELPKKFKWINWIILLPIIVWPFVFFFSIFIFDDPNANPTKAWLLFCAINAYPLYLFVLFELNARLYLKSNAAGYILPLLTLGTILFIIGNIYYSEKKAVRAREAKEQLRRDAGYIGNCDSYKIIDKVVYYYEDTLVNADAASFEFINCNFGKDKNTAYKGIDPILNSHPESFVMIDFKWQKDDYRYYFKGKALEDIDYPSFEILNIGYAKDKNKVYFGNNVVEDADPQTFKVNIITGIGVDGLKEFKDGIWRNKP